MKRTSIERFVFSVILIIIWFLTLIKVRSINIYHSSLSGQIEEIYFSPRDRSDILLKFKNTNQLNQLSTIRNKKMYIDGTMLMKGDSIHKQMFIEGYDVYRKINEKYVYLYHINSEK